MFPSITTRLSEGKLILSKESALDFLKTECSSHSFKFESISSKIDGVNTKYRFCCIKCKTKFSVYTEYETYNCISTNLESFNAKCHQVIMEKACW